MDSLTRKFKRDERVWDECASTYENQIVCGHPDILAYEAFEEEFIDQVLVHLARVQDRPIKLMDVGCGSGRLHLRYGCKTARDENIPPQHPLFQKKANRHSLGYDPVLARGLGEVWGVDFSANMIELAEQKVSRLGIEERASCALTFEKGSAFELKPQAGDTLPLAVCLINSIGVMQGPEGAEALFRSMRQAVEPAGGIAIISCYQQKYIPSYGLGQYESTLDVSGQPAWLMPDTYTSSGYVQVARSYKRAHSRDETLLVDVFDAQGEPVKQDHLLRRDPQMSAQAATTGRIRTHSDYKSHWYAFDQVAQWKNTLWSNHAIHFETRVLDGLRAEPAQMAILDCGHHLGELFERWNLV